MIKRICDVCRIRKAVYHFLKWLYTDSDDSGCGSNKVYQHTDYCKECFDKVKKEEFDIVEEIK